MEKKKENGLNGMIMATNTVNKNIRMEKQQENGVIGIMKITLIKLSVLFYFLIFFTFWFCNTFSCFLAHALCFSITWFSTSTLYSVFNKS